jgi:membrane protein
MPRIPPRPALLLKRLYAAAKEDDIAGGAAELAFRFFLALFPFFIFLAALGGFVADIAGVENPTEEIMDALGKSLPSDTASVLRSQLEDVIEKRNAGLVSVAVVATIIAASSGVGTLIKRVNTAYNVRETRPQWQRWALAAALTVAGGVVLVAAFVVFVAGQVYGLQIAEDIGMGRLAGELFRFARWPAVGVLALMVTAVIYRQAPNTRLSLQGVLPGAGLFALGWLLATWLFGLYVGHFGSYNETYGTLAGVVVALLWFYITGFILLLGAELNAVLQEETSNREQGRG